MSISLPEALYSAPRAPAWRTILTITAAVLVVLSGWQLFGLPGTLVKKYSPPYDMPWYGWGLRGVFIKPDGNWVIHRTGYADRMSKYELTADGKLQRFEDTGGIFTEKDVSGTYHGGSKIMDSRNYVQVLFHRPYIDWLRSLREPETDDDEFYIEKADEYIGANEGYITVRTFGVIADEKHRVLAGHHFFPVFDSWGYVDPHLWLTSDRVRYLHRLYASDRDGEVRVTAEQTVALKLKEEAQRGCTVGFDPFRDQVFLVTASGQRYWFNPQSLASAGQDQLPGCWLPEHAEIGNLRPGYNFDLGVPLTHAGYERLMRVLMIVFLLSLVWRAIQWRMAWKYTLAATTAGSSSDAKSSNT